MGNASRVPGVPGDRPVGSTRLHGAENGDVNGYIMGISLSRYHMISSHIHM